MKVLTIFLACVILYAAKETSANPLPYERCRWQCDVIDCDYYYDMCEYDCYEVCLPFPFLRGQRAGTKTSNQASASPVRGSATKEIYPLVREETERKKEEAYAKTGKSIRLVFTNPKSTMEVASKGRQTSVQSSPKSFALTQSCLSDISRRDQV